MASSRRAILAVVAGVGALKFAGDRFGQPPAENSGSERPAESETLYHERQNVYLEPGQAFAETFESTGENTLRLRIPDFPTLGGHAGLYTYEEWTNLKERAERHGDWDGGDPIETLPIDPEKSVYEFPLTRDGRYAIVLRVDETHSASNVELEYWVLD